MPVGKTMAKLHSNGMNGETIADRLGLGREPRQLKLGSSFGNRGTAFHTMRYDFKPASVDTSKMATVDVGQGNMVTVTVPHLDGAGTSQTIFRGSRKPYQKECVLIIDQNTGEIVLEKLTNNMQVKKTRLESRAPAARPLTPVDSSLKKPSPRPKSSSTSPLPSRPSQSPLVPRHSPLAPSPNQRISPTYSNHGLSPIQSVSNGLSPNMPTAARGSMPIIGFGDDDPVPQRMEEAPPVGILSESSSDSSSSSSSSDSEDSDVEDATTKGQNGRTNGTSPSLSMPSHLLSEDLQLSESGSECD